MLEDTHDRWIDQLKRDLPQDVPLDDRLQKRYGEAWPETFDKEGRSRQCMDCAHHVTLEGRLGSDWGACTNPKSQYDRQCTFEHWTCAYFTPSGVEDDG